VRHFHSGRNGRRRRRSLAGTLWLVAAGLALALVVQALLR
jgi:hypothetical protein